jgi:hypothetical protein
LDYMSRSCITLGKTWLMIILPWTCCSCRHEARRRVFPLRSV